VIGEQPVLAPGERFKYTSGVPLPTPSGFMTGRYQMVSETGEQFEIEVPTSRSTARRRAGAELESLRCAHNVQAARVGARVWARSRGRIGCPRIGCHVNS